MLHLLHLKKKGNEQEQNETNNERTTRKRGTVARVGRGRAPGMEHRTVGGVGGCDAPGLGDTPGGMGGRTVGGVEREDDPGTEQQTFTRIVSGYNLNGTFRQIHGTF